MKMVMKFMLISSLTVATLFYTGGGNTGTVSAGSHYLDVDSYLQKGLSDLVQVDAIGSELSIDKGKTSIPLGSKTTSISLKNQNGTIEFKQGPVKDIEVHMKVVVNHATKEEAKAVANKTKLQVQQGTALGINAYSEPYGEGNQYYPSVHLTITLPQKVSSDLQVEVKNGNISLSKVTSIGRIKLGTQNGNITAKEIGNDISLQTVNGMIHVSDAKKSVAATATNGNIEANTISGALQMETTNGNLSSKNALASIKATTVAGNVQIESNKVGGDWEVSSTVGNVNLLWPEKAGVKVSGSTSFGEIETDFPLTVKRSSVTGKIGSGSYQIHVSSMNGISLMKN